MKIPLLSSEPISFNFRGRFRCCVITTAPSFCGTALSPLEPATPTVTRWAKSSESSLCRSLLGCSPGGLSLVAEILNPTIQRWFPAILIDVRSSGNTTLQLDSAHRDLRRAFGGNFRYWLYTWPVLRLPLPMARVWQKAGAAACKALYAITVPGFWRKQT